MTISLSTESVSKVYRGDNAAIRAVDGISMEVRQGEFLALVGPSGSGKTTLLAMLAALLRPSEGRIAIDGHDLNALSEAERSIFRRQKIGFTFQAHNLVSYLTARENVELMLRLNGWLDRAGRARSRELLERLGLGERLNSLPRQLSGGQQQRVAIARALIHEPSVVLADEPTASLDTERAFQVVSTFANITREQNRAGIMVTHDLRMCQFVDLVIQMKDGKLIRVIEEPEQIRAFAGGAQHEPEVIAATEADVALDEATLAQAKAALDQTALCAPLAGVIAKLSAVAGEDASPGVVLAQVADLSDWYIETTDLTELNVVNVKEGDQVAVTFDALPGETFGGQVVRIRPLGEVQKGDMTYTAIVRPDRLDPRLRWNMTASVGFGE